MHSVSHKHKIRKTQKRTRTTKTTTIKKHAIIIQSFLQLLNTIKLYHWKTKTFSQHKATDELYSKLNENIDSFVEILLGKTQSRIQMVEKKIRLIDNNTKAEFTHTIHEYREFLIQMNDIFDSKRDTDLLNIRDEILGNINQFLYLMSFDH
jgi:DNA-binding ferritin-like protein